MTRLVGALVVSLVLVGYGLLAFDRGDDLTRLSLGLGIGFLTLTIAALIRAGWWGSADGWFLAAIGAAILAWAIYEGMRRGGCGLDPAGAPVPCFADVGSLAGVFAGGAASLVIVGLGWWRLQRVRPPGR